MPKDIIVYQVIAAPGGCDGLDKTAKGGVVRVYTTREAAEKFTGSDSRYTIDMRAVDLDVIKKGALSKLSLIEQLALGHGEPEQVQPGQRL